MRAACRCLVVALAGCSADGAGARAVGGGGSGASTGDAAGGASGSGGAGGTGGSSVGGTSGSAGSSAGSAGSSAGSAGSSAGNAGAAGAPMGYDLRAADRDACAFGPGSRTTETVGPNVPHGDALPFEHIVVLMMENRSFDHYFSELPRAGVTDADVATDTDMNYDPSKFPPEPVPRFHETRMCVVDLAHHWTEVHLQHSTGAMDGFVGTNNPGGARAMGYHDESDLPYYYWLAKNFAISDRHFCSLLGPTWPNRFYFYSATSWGNTKTGDVGLLVNTKYQSATTVMDQLEQAGRSWRIYRDGLVSFGLLFNPLKYAGLPMNQFVADVASDNLPDVAILDPNFTGSGQNDEHPPTNPQLGQELTARVVSALMSNPAVWRKTVFILFYDEHGGYFDHVPPPPACEPDNDVPPDWRFDRLGIRTPLVVVSPFARRGYVSHVVTDITSVTRFIQNRFDLPAMTYRDANAWPMLDLFDFEAPPHSTPPPGAPVGTAPQAGKDWCASNPPGNGLP